MNKGHQKVTTAWLRRLGFDKSYYDRSAMYHRVKCSQCESAVINGVPTHETGCPNRPGSR